MTELILGLRVIDGNLNTNNTRSHFDVTNSLIDKHFPWDTSRDDLTVSVFLGISTLLSQLSRDDNLTAGSLSAKSVLDNSHSSLTDRSLLLDFNTELIS